MTLINETNQAVMYTITCATSADCGQIDVNGIADLPYYDNQQNVQVYFSPVDNPAFTIVAENTHSGQQAEMALVVELGNEGNE